MSFKRHFLKFSLDIAYGYRLIHKNINVIIIPLKKIEFYLSEIFNLCCQKRDRIKVLKVYLSISNSQKLCRKT